MARIAIEDIKPGHYVLFDTYMYYRHAGPPFLVKSVTDKQVKVVEVRDIDSWPVDYPGQAKAKKSIRYVFDSLQEAQIVSTYARKFQENAEAKIREIEKSIIADMDAAADNVSLIIEEHNKA